MEKIIKDIQKIVEKFFQKATFDVSYQVELDEDNIVKLALEMDEPQILIGERGSTLAELQRLLGNIVRKQVGQPVLLDVDINGYKQKRHEYLCNLANNIADRVSLVKRPEALFPMNSYERRLVHTELANRADIKTESEGEGEERRILIKPAQNVAY